MTDRRHHLPCPVCLGVHLTRVVVGTNRPVEIDFCQRCGGLFLEHGEVQRLRAQGERRLRLQVGCRSTPQPSQCHECHAPLDRDAPQCAACGRANLLACPECDRPMEIVWHQELRLDVCPACKGSWFDHHEREALWGPRFDAALARRHVSSVGDPTTTAVLTGEVLLDSLFFAPDLLFMGASAAGEVATAAGSALVHLPETIVASPEAASIVLEAITETSASVFEAIVEIVSGAAG